mmetsp:Transcript_4894/g.11676  ORF Transcript_4894/g.11676 Transcript_4894/m.11676 type:complete len:271 (-) Transcript_4894:128-940(-)
MNESTQLAILGESLNKSLRLVDSQQIKMASFIPGWVRFCSNTAPLAAIVVFMAPMPTIQQIERERTVGNLPLLPYSSMIANCVLWFVYGLLLKQSKVWFTNGVGLFFGLYYFLRFIKYTTPKSTSLPGSVRQHAQGCLAIIATSAVWVLTCYLTVRRKGMWMSYAAGLIGNTAVLFCLLMFASPLSALQTVLRTRSAKSIPLPFTLATILNCFLWSVAGLGEFKDFNIYFPNLLGLAFGLIQVGLKIIFDYGPTSGKSEIKSEDKIDLMS